MTMLVLGHRGAPDRELENTLASFRTAMSLGADGIELDVRRTRDGEFVVHHDPCLPGSRTPIEKMTYGRLSRTRLSDGKNAPKLSHVLGELPAGSAIVVELKGRAAARDLDGVLGPALQRPGLRVSSFNHRMVAPLARKGYAIALTVDRIPKDFISKAVRLGAREIHVRHERLNRALVRTAKLRGLRVLAWTVNRAQDVARMALLDVDGIITNDVDMARRALR